MALEPAVPTTNLIRAGLTHEKSPSITQTYWIWRKLER
jgi:hypothetical protein